MGTDPVETSPGTPGIGVAGIVMCPEFKSPCLKGGCEYWVELNYGKQKVGRCANAWKPKLAVEIREELERLRKSIEAKGT